MRLIILAAAILGADEKAPTTLQAERAIVFVNGPSWVTWKAAVESKSELQLPAGVDVGSLAFSSDDSKPVAVKIVGESPVPGEGEFVEVTRKGQSFLGRLSGPVEKPSLTMMFGERRTFTADEVEAIIAHAPKKARLETAQPGEISLRGSGFVSGLNWKPSYRLHLGVESSARLTVTAQVVNASPAALDYPSVQLAVIEPVKSSAYPALETTQYEWGPLQLPAQSAATKTLFDGPAEVEEVVHWEVGEPAFEGIRPAKADRLTTHLVLAPPEQNGSLAAGTVVVVQGELPVASLPMPFVAAEQRATLELGPPAGIAIQREETELERNQSEVQRENHYYDWVRMTGMLKIHNKRTTPVKMHVVKSFKGEGTAASDNGQISRQPNAVGDGQARSQIAWNLTIPAGQEKRLTFGYVLHLERK